MRRSRIYLGTVAVLLTGLSLQAAWAGRTAQQHVRRNVPILRQLVVTLSLTDLALWSEARYTRHPSMSDLFSPFQDHPGALEHFPAGSLLMPSGPRPTTTLDVARRDAERP